MGKNVDSEDFWKERIDSSKAAGLLHHSVYRAHPELWQAIEDRHRGIIMDHVDESKPVLDIACGYGRFAKYFDESVYTGVDFSQDFIEIAQENNKRHSFVRSRIEDLPFEDNQFEWGFGVSIKRMIIEQLGEDRWSTMEEELKRVCKNIIFLEYSDGNQGHLNESYEVIK